MLEPECDGGGGGGVVVRAKRAVRRGDELGVGGAEPRHAEMHEPERDGGGGGSVVVRAQRLFGATGVKLLQSIGMIENVPGMKCLDMNAAEDAIVKHTEVVPVVIVTGMEVAEIDGSPRIVRV